MNFLIITKSVYPVRCGIGDYSLIFAEYLASYGHDVKIVASDGEENKNIIIIKNFWLKSNWFIALEKINLLNINHIILQFTPQMYSENKFGTAFGIANFWKLCLTKWNSTVVLHETYFRAYWHLPSLVRGTIEKFFLKMIVKNSQNVVTASELLFNEIKSWKNHRVYNIPIGSNFKFNFSDDNNFRIRNGIEPTDIILTIFGGASGFRKVKYLIQNLDDILKAKNISSKWLLLGGVNVKGIDFKLPVLNPGYISNETISLWLQSADIFLFPQISGVSLKRGTIIAALQHGLPIVGINGSMTDSIWHNMKGVVVTKLNQKGEFEKKVLDLVYSNELRQSMGRANKDYFDRNLSWENIINKFLKFIQ